jgi:hypothetical protein
MQQRHRNLTQVVGLWSTWRYCFILLKYWVSLDKAYSSWVDLGQILNLRLLRSTLKSIQWTRVVVVLHCVLIFELRSELLWWEGVVEVTFNKEGSVLRWNCLVLDYNHRHLTLQALAIRWYSVVMWRSLFLNGTWSGNLIYNWFCLEQDWVSISLTWQNRLQLFRFFCNKLVESLIRMNIYWSNRGRRGVYQTESLRL